MYINKKQEIIDVLVIGAGASGAAFTWSIAEAGISTICLEQGPEINPKKYPVYKQDWELSLNEQYNPDPNIRKLYQDYPINNNNSDIIPVMYNAIGGSTIIWMAHFPRLHPSDFRVKTLDGVAENWPITYKTLEKYYEINDKIMGVSGLNGDTAYPKKEPRTTKPLPFGKIGEIVSKGFDKLGWHWWPSDSAIISQPFDSREECNSGGTCGIGCVRRAKASVDVTYWPKALYKGAEIYDNSRVKNIIIGKDGLAKGVEYFDDNGTINFQAAKIVVLACNGIGTPRLLLNSTSNLFPDGLANSSGMIGKNLMFHPVSSVTGFFENDLEGYKGPPGCLIYSHEFYETDKSRDFLRGFGIQVNRGAGPLSTAIGNFGYDKIPWGKNHRKEFFERYGKTITLGIHAEDLPELSNSVTLDPYLVDSNGIPAPKINYKISENTKKILEYGNNRGSELMEACKAKRIIVNPLAPGTNGCHLMGTTRMGKNKNTSVVNKFGKTHDVNNLYIIDGSVFVTAGAVNPTSTIQAFALYVANHIKNL